MYHHFVPISLHASAQALINQLQALNHAPSQCPHCQHTRFYIINAEAGYYRCKSCHKGFNRSTSTPYHRLAPLAWLPLIAQLRLCGKSYAAIRYKLDYCTSATVKRRVNVIEQQMANSYPALYRWYQGFMEVGKTIQPTAVIEEIQQLKDWVNRLLQGDNLTCPYCQSDKIKKVTKTRARYRCQTCWRYFSNLAGSGLEHLSYSQHWLTIIDMLSAGKTIKAISETLNISHSTVTKARRTWLHIIQQQELLVLFEWIS